MVSRFKLLLQHLNMSAAEFASRIGVQRSSMSHVLSGRNKPSIDFLEKILHVFPEVNAGWLINGIGNWKAEMGMTVSEEVKISTETAALDENSKPVAEVPASVELLQSDRNNNKAPAVQNEGPVDHIIIVYKDNTFRILNPARKPD